MSKKIVIIMGNPNLDSYCASLAKAYKEGATLSGAEVKEIVVSHLDFNPNLTHGFKSEGPLERDLVEAQETIKWADHLVFVYPTWWGTMPAILKGFIDRVFLPGFAFKYRQGSTLWDKLLSGKTARLIVTMDGPYWFFSLFQGKPGHRAMKKSILEFCGVKPVRITSIDALKKSTHMKRLEWLGKVQQLGRTMK